MQSSFFTELLCGQWEGIFMCRLGPGFENLYTESAVLSGAGSSRVAFELEGKQCGNAGEGALKKELMSF